MTAKKRQKEQLIATVAKILATGEPTYFQHEGRMVATLRTLWCLGGSSWQRSNDYAVEIVGEALGLIGARRPSWLEGQPEHLSTWLYDKGICRFCGAEFVRVGPHPMQVKYCSSKCMEANARRKPDRIAYVNGWKRDKYAKLKEAQPEKPCEECGRPFKPSIRQGKPTRFCSIRCRNANTSRKAKMNGRGLCPSDPARCTHAVPDKIEGSAKSA